MTPEVKEQRLGIVRQLRDHLAQPDVFTARQATLYSRRLRHQLGSQDIRWSASLSSE